MSELNSVEVDGRAASDSLASVKLGSPRARSSSAALSTTSSANLSSGENGDSPFVPKRRYSQKRDDCLNKLQTVPRWVFLLLQSICVLTSGILLSLTNVSFITVCVPLIFYLALLAMFYALKMPCCPRPSNGMPMHRPVLGNLHEVSIVFSYAAISVFIIFSAGMLNASRTFSGKNIVEHIVPFLKSKEILQSSPLLYHRLWWLYYVIGFLAFSSGPIYWWKEAHYDAISKYIPLFDEDGFSLPKITNKENVVSFRYAYHNRLSMLNAVACLVYFIIVCACNFGISQQSPQIQLERAVYALFYYLPMLMSVCGFLHVICYRAHLDMIWLGDETSQSPPAHPNGLQLDSGVIPKPRSLDFLYRSSLSPKYTPKDVLLLIQVRVAFAAAIIHAAISCIFCYAVYRNIASITSVITKPLWLSGFWIVNTVIFSVWTLIESICRYALDK